MTAQEFTQTAFYFGQRAIWAREESIVLGFSPIENRICIGEVDGDVLGFIKCEDVELVDPCPLQILREIRRRLRDSLGEGYPERLSPDILEQIDNILGDEE